MNGIDLQLQGSEASDAITAFVTTATGTQPFPLTLPADLCAQQQAWKRRFLLLHGSPQPEIGADAVRIYGERLVRTLAAWWQEPQWFPLQQQLSAHPDLPLRLRCSGTAASLERLPWESLPLDRPLWRLPAVQLPSVVVSRGAVPSRRPRLLALIGDESSLQLEDEIAVLDQLRRCNQIELQLLRGQACHPTAVRQQLGAAQGWDGLIFLGHSEADPSGGGRLHLGDGSWLAAQALASELRQAVARGLQLALLNSCSGIDIAQTLLTAGLSWVLCFREPVPSQAAALAFTTLLSCLETGTPWLAAVDQVRRELDLHGPIGSHLLLSLYASTGAEALCLPMSSRQRFLQRLATSRPSQLAAASLAFAIGAWMDLAPFQPLPLQLLDQRLQAQTLWRQWTGQPGRTPSPLPVLLLEDSEESIPGGNTASQVISRQALAQVLRTTATERIPRLGFDVVLDRVGPDPAAMDELVQSLAAQPQRRVFAGYFGASTAAPRAGDSSLPLNALRQAGLQAFDLSAGVAPGSDGSGLKPQPLRLIETISSRHFAHALAGAPAHAMPADAVIDWSLAWQRSIRRVRPEELGSLVTPTLLVGGDGYHGENRVDLFRSPLSAEPLLLSSGGARGELSGALLQAVLAVSLRDQSWLWPASVAGTSLLSGGLGVLLAAAVAQRGQRALVIGGITLLAIPLCLQLGISQRLLVPLLVPTAAFAATGLLRHR